MSKFQDLTGFVFGQLEVIEQAEKRKLPSGAYVTMWNCKCNCKRSGIFPVAASHLKSGHTTSCIKCGQERTAKSRFKDLSGKSFGNLFVLKQGDDVFSKEGVRITTWIVQCNCMRVDPFPVRGANLTSGNTTGCRKCHNDKVGIISLKDLTNKKFGKLTVMRRGDDYIQENGVRNVTWIVKCDCGSEPFNALASCLSSGKTKSCGCLKESFIASELKKYFTENYDAEKEKKLFKNPETNQWLKCDIYIPCGENPNLNGFYIEVHGGQHYIFVEYFHKTMENFENCKKKDKLKNNFCKKNGFYIEIDLRKIKTIEEAIEYIENILEKNLFYE
jgi:hypothetical protein